MSLIRGNVIEWSGRPGMLAVVEDIEGSRRVVALFDSHDRLTLALDSVKHVLYELREHVRTPDGETGYVLNRIDRGGLVWYELQTPNGRRSFPETDLRPHIDTDPAAMLAAGRLQSPLDFQVRAMAARALFAHDSDTLSSLGNARVELKEHQVGVLHRVATSYPHRFLLADEVGLGKTIEAGLIMKELKARRLADRVLVVVPAGLRRQWQFEFLNKFNERFAIFTTDTVRFLRDRGSNNPWRDETQVICSHDFAAAEDRQQEIAEAGWDMVIFDEAHHVRRTPDRTTLLYRLAQRLTDPELDRQQSMLLLTATPMQLDRYELYSLLEVLDPALFPSEDAFARHLDELPGLNALVERVLRYQQLSPEERESSCLEVSLHLDLHLPTVRKLLDDAIQRETVAEQLRSLHKLSEVMVRNRKSVVGGFTRREAKTILVDLTRDEQELYDAVTRYTRLGFASSRLDNDNAVGFLMTTFQKLLASSTFALACSLRRRVGKLEGKLQAEDEGFDADELEDQKAPGGWLSALGKRALKEELQSLQHLIGLAERASVDSKAAAFVAALEQILARDPDERVLVFTQSRDTQEYLRRLIGERWSVGLFYGNLKDIEKDLVVHSFQRGTVKVLISTEAGGEGRNFQFAHIVFNYDLPWNPMKVEQRIGRVDRIGQTRDILVYNLACRKTIEERVIDVLERRIRLFEQTVGGLDPILGHLEDSIRDIVFGEPAARDAALERLGIELEQKIERARERERQLADLIMDARSFSREYVREVLGREPEISRQDLRVIVLQLLGRYRTFIQKIDETTTRIVYHGPFFKTFGENLIDVRGRGNSYEVTFNPDRARLDELLEFFAFGHPVVDAVVNKALEPGAPGSATCWRVVGAKACAGFLFLYEISFVGFRTMRELFPVFIDDSGASQPEIASELLVRCRRMEGESETPATAFPAVGEAKAVADRVVLDHVDARTQ